MPIMSQEEFTSTFMSGLWEGISMVLKQPAFWGLVAILVAYQILMNVARKRKKRKRQEQREAQSQELRELKELREWHREQEIRAKIEAEQRRERLSSPSSGSTYRSGGKTPGSNYKGRK